ncbi:hypothetical protein MBLNU457_3443t1 [Dothideomycetes sp. NU457]
MSELHDALKALDSTEWSDVPADNPKSFMQHQFEAGELICNSVPPPPGGTAYDAATPSQSTVDSASSSKDVSASDARPQDPHPSHVELRSAWGKPMKLSAKDNPLGVSVYKMAGKDRNGAWFARRSIHEGVSFSKFQKAMAWEFAESLAVEGGPGAGAVRGLAADSRLEKKQVEGVGQLEVYQLSAQFPGPTTPREFITLLLTSSHAIGEKTGAGQPPPRHYMIVSKPCDHPSATERNGYIRGHYESVEMIREIPLHHKSGDKEKADLNPVEWIMVTRSDPGGGIPRFMVERGTPAGICSDVSKFLDWAASKNKDDIPDPNSEQEMQKASEKKKQESPAIQSGPATNGKVAQGPPRQEAVAQQPASSGLVGQLTGALDAYAPVVVSQAAHEYLDPQQQPQPTVFAAPDTSDSDSDSDYESADDFAGGNRGQQSTTSLNTTSSTTDSIVKSGSHEDKELQKLASQRRKLDRKLAEKRQAEEERLKNHEQSDAGDVEKAKSKHDKEMTKAQEKYDKDISKLESKREKELEKARKKRDKQLDKDVLSKVTRERDDFRHRVDLIQKENDLLRKQISDVQAENTALASKLSALTGANVPAGRTSG